MSACKVYEAINRVSAALSQCGIGKDRKNSQQNYNFRGIDDVLNHLSPLLAQNKLAILPRILERKCDERMSKSGSPIFYTTVDAEFDFVSCEDGSKHTVRMFGEAMDSADKSTNKAMSAAYKYAAFQAFCIPVEGVMQDADQDTPEIASKGAPNASTWGSKKTEPVKQADQPKAPETPKLTPEEIATKSKDLWDWALCMLNPEHFKRTPETTNFATYKDQLLKDGAGLPEAELRKLRAHAYCQFLLCMTCTSPEGELEDWKGKIAGSKLDDAQIKFLNTAWMQTKDALKGVAA